MPNSQKNPVSLQENEKQILDSLKENLPENSPLSLVEKVATTKNVKVSFSKVYGQTFKYTNPTEISGQVVLVQVIGLQYKDSSHKSYLKGFENKVYIPMRMYFIQAETCVYIAGSKKDVICLGEFLQGTADTLTSIHDSIVKVTTIDTISKELILQVLQVIELSNLFNGVNSNFEVSIDKINIL